MTNANEDRSTTSEGQALEQSISKILTGAGFKFEKEPSVGGLRPDFIVYGPEGQTVVIEAKTSLGGGNLERARHQVLHYKQATGANAAIIVTKSEHKSPTTSDISSLASLLADLKSTLEIAKSSTSSLKAMSNSSRTVFAAMPFSAKYDDVYFVSMTYAAEGIEAACRRVDKEDFSGDIPAKLQQMIRDSIAVIADLSEAKPNVLYELGFAHALNKPVIHICSTPLTELPFDVRNWVTLSYEVGRTHEFRTPLRSKLASVVNAS
ncbi:MAG: hypothetical protein WB766_23095 [Roseiarcus sp.]